MEAFMFGSGCFTGILVILFLLSLSNDDKPLARSVRRYLKNMGRDLKRDDAWIMQQILAIGEDESFEALKSLEKMLNQKLYTLEDGLSNERRKEVCQAVTEAESGAKEIQQAQAISEK